MPEPLPSEADQVQEPAEPIRVELARQAAAAQVGQCPCKQTREFKIQLEVSFPRIKATSLAMLRTAVLNWVREWPPTEPLFGIGLCVIKGEGYQDDRAKTSAQP